MSLGRPEATKVTQLRSLRHTVISSSDCTKIFVHKSMPLAPFTFLFYLLVQNYTYNFSKIIITKDSEKPVLCILIEKSFLEKNHRIPGSVYMRAQERRGNDDSK